MSNDQGVEKKFLVKGRKVLVDEWIGNPLPPIELKDTVSSHVKISFIPTNAGSFSCR